MNIKCVTNLVINLFFPQSVEIYKTCIYISILEWIDFLTHKKTEYFPIFSLTICKIISTILDREIASFLVSVCDWFFSYLNINLHFVEVSHRFTLVKCLSVCLFVLVCVRITVRSSYCVFVLLCVCLAVFSSHWTVHSSHCIGTLLALCLSQWGWLWLLGRIGVNQPSHCSNLISKFYIKHNIMNNSL